MRKRVTPTVYITRIKSFYRLPNLFHKYKSRQHSDRNFDDHAENIASQIHYVWFCQISYPVVYEEYHVLSLSISLKQQSSAMTSTYIVFQTSIISISSPLIIRHELVASTISPHPLNSQPHFSTNPLLISQPRTSHGVSQTTRPLYSS